MWLGRLVFSGGMVSIDNKYVALSSKVEKY